MPRAKNDTLIKKTMNFRKGDFEKMEALFPDKNPSVSIRDLVSAFVDKHYSKPASTVDIDEQL
ncbi:MAG: hypothetical protein CL484_03165 [Acidobacteria bacterium]|nr:hypothetical protein [Acidobacteriota bacterium]